MRTLKQLKQQINECDKNVFHHENSFFRDKKQIKIDIENFKNHPPLIFKIALLGCLCLLASSSIRKKLGRFNNKFLVVLLNFRLSMSLFSMLLPRKTKQFAKQLLLTKIRSTAD